MPIPELRDYQFDLVNQARAARASGARVVVIQAGTGSGKTSVACHIMKQAALKGSTGLFLVHRRKLVDQISSRLEEFQVNHGVIMRGERPYKEALIQVASRDTMMSRYIDNQWIDLPNADIIIVDEAHRAADPQSEHRRILERYPRATILLMTATPVGPEGQGLGPFAQAMVCAPPTSKLIEGGFLVPVKCYAPDRKMHRGKAKRGIAGDLVESWKSYAEGMPTVLFTSRVKHSLDAVAAFNEAGIDAAHIDQSTPDAVRDSHFEALEAGRIKVISNVGIIREGVDLPCIGCVQLYMEMTGRVAFIQSCGRMMRPFEGKTHGVLIDHAGVIFKHGFPDEDTEWTLDGDADARFKKKRLEGKTNDVHYCKNCERLFSETTCPGCGRHPVKPPRSIFAAEPVRSSDELLLEADRGEQAEPHRDDKVKHYLRCVAAAANKNGSFAMAAIIYKQKFGEWPGHDFPCNPGPSGRTQRILDVYPKFRRQKKAAS